MLRPYKGKRQKAPEEERLARVMRNEDYSFLDQGGTTPDMRA
jgi:hypothetical protein